MAFYIDRMLMSDIMTIYRHVRKGEVLWQVNQYKEVKH